MADESKNSSDSAINSLPSMILWCKVKHFDIVMKILGAEVMKFGRKGKPHSSTLSINGKYVSYISKKKSDRDSRGCKSGCVCPSFSMVLFG